MWAQKSDFCSAALPLALWILLMSMAFSWSCFNYKLMPYQWICTSVALHTELCWGWRDDEWVLVRRLSASCVLLKYFKIKEINHLIHLVSYLCLLTAAHSNLFQSFVVEYLSFSLNVSNLMLFGWKLLRHSSQLSAIFQTFIVFHLTQLEWDKQTHWSGFIRFGENLEKTSCGLCWKVSEFLFVWMV